MGENHCEILETSSFTLQGGQLVCSPAVAEMQEPEGQNGEKLQSGQMAAAHRLRKTFGHCQAQYWGLRPSFKGIK